MKNKILVLVLISFSLLINSCSDDPNSVGNALIPDQDKLQTKIIDSHKEGFNQEFTSFQKEDVFLGSANRILLGKYRNIQSDVFLSFLISLPDSIEESFEDGENIALVDSWIELYPNYWIGDSNDFSLSVHKINDHWTSITLTQDSIDLIYSNKGSDILNTFEYESGDTSMKLTIDNDLVDEWVKSTYDDSAPDNNGVILTPTNTNAIAGFQGLTTFPLDLYPSLFMVFEKDGEIVDTIKAISKLDIHIPDGKRLDDPTNSILLQGSIFVRGKLWFDISSVPNNILVNSAILQFSVDEVNSFEGSEPTDTISVSFYYDSDADSINYAYGKYPIKKNSSGEFTGEIRQFVQRWLDGEPNEGMEVRLSDEYRSAAGISLYGSTHPIDSLKPRLKIYYTDK